MYHIFYYFDCAFKTNHSMCDTRYLKLKANGVEHNSTGLYLAELAEGLILTYRCGTALTFA